MKSFSVDALNKSIFGQRFISIALLFLCTSFVHASSVDSSDGVVSRLYKDFAWEAVVSRPDDVLNLFGASIESQPKNVLETYFDEDLTVLLLKNEACEKKNVDACNLDFDPIFSTQDSAASDLTIKSLDSSRIEVSFTYPSTKEKFVLSYVTKKTAHGWRIVDIVYHNRNEKSLKKILENKPSM